MPQSTSCTCFFTLCISMQFLFLWRLAASCAVPRIQSLYFHSKGCCISCSRCHLRKPCLSALQSSLEENSFPNCGYMASMSGYADTICQKASI